MKEGAHSLKGSSGYIGASHLHYACYFIQEHFMFERPALMMEYYPTLIEAAIEFRVFSRKIIAEYKGINLKITITIGQVYEINPEHESVPMAEGYRVEKDN